MQYILQENYRDLPEYKFLEKYKNQENIYVRFSSVKPSNFISIYRHRDHKDHKDPSGIYAFPLSYVLKNFSNQMTNIFFSLPYILILEDVSSSKFFVDEPITIEQALTITNLMKFSLLECASNLIRKKQEILKKSNYLEGMKEIVQNIRKKQYKKPVDMFAFFTCTQWSPDGENILNGEEQRFRWISAGFDALEDRGSGVINRDEPYQIIFLKENSCLFLDSYDRTNFMKKSQNSELSKTLAGRNPNFSKLNAKLEDQWLSLSQENILNGERLLQKLAALILTDALSDTITQRGTFTVLDIKETPLPKAPIQVLSKYEMNGKKYRISILCAFLDIHLQKLKLAIHVYNQETETKILTHQTYLDDTTRIDDIVSEIYEKF